MRNFRKEYCIEKGLNYIKPENSMMNNYIVYLEEKLNEAINYTHSCEELNALFGKGDNVIYCSVINATVIEDLKNGLVRIKDEYGETLNVKAIELEKGSV